MKSFIRGIGIALCLMNPALAEEPFRPARCEVVPLADFQTSLRIDGVEKIRWRFGAEYPGPFFYPLNSPRGGVLTRMGHPGAPNHDHHRSVWFAHHDVGGIDFWSIASNNQIRQKAWYAYQDGEEECVMASVLGWYDSDGAEVLEQDLVVALLPMADGDHAVEVQFTIRPAGERKRVELEKTNFGLFAVRVASSVSAHFGGGQLTNDAGGQGEEAIFGLPSRWVDYSGPVAAGEGPERSVEVEGVTYFDHPANPRYPTPWHVRSDGWMGAAFCLNEGFVVEPDSPLTLRYLLHSHRGSYDRPEAERIHREFANRTAFIITKSTRPHRQYEVGRQASAGD